jgi:hypothetical protein
MKTTISPSTLRLIRKALKQTIKAVDLNGVLSTDDGPHGTESERELAEIDAAQLASEALAALSKAGE